MRRVTDDAELARGLLERVELREELLLGELLRRKAALALVVGVDEVLHGRSFSCCIVYMHDRSRAPAGGFRISCGADEIVQVAADEIPPPITQLAPQRQLGLLPQRQRLAQLRPS